MCKKRQECGVCQVPGGGCSVYKHPVRARLYPHPRRVMTSGPAGSKAAAHRRLGRRSRLGSAAGAAMALGLVVAGCHVPGTGSSSAAPGLSTITVAAQPGVADAGLYLAQRNGLFKNAGLTVNIQNYSSVGKEISALSSGAAQMAIGDYFNFFAAEDQPSNPGFVVVADAYDAAPSVMQVLASPA